MAFPHGPGCPRRGPDGGFGCPAPDDLHLDGRLSGSADGASPHRVVRPSRVDSLRPVAVPCPGQDRHRALPFGTCQAEELRTSTATARVGKPESVVITRSAPRTTAVATTRASGTPRAPA